MKSKSKHSKTNEVNLSKKSLKNLNAQNKAKPTSKKCDIELRKSLTETLKLLQSRLVVKQPSLKNNMSLLGLSKSIYDIVNENICQKPRPTSSMTRDTCSAMSSMTQRGRERERQKSYSSYSNSIMQYFKDKFEQNSVDVHFMRIQKQSMERKLKAMKAIRKSQQLVSKYNSQYNSSICSIPDFGCDADAREFLVGKLNKNQK